MRSAPATSPNHHVTQIDPYSLHDAYPASDNVVTPVVALTIGLGSADIDAARFRLLMKSWRASPDSRTADTQAALRGTGVRTIQGLPSPNANRASRPKPIRWCRSPPAVQRRASQRVPHARCASPADECG